MTTTRKHITPNQREIQMNDAKSDWEKLQQARQLHAAAEEQRQARRSAEAWDARQREHRRVQDMIDAMGSALAEDGRRRAEERGREAPEFFVSNKEADEIRLRSSPCRRTTGRSRSDSTSGPSGSERPRGRSTRSWKAKMARPRSKRHDDLCRTTHERPAHELARMDRGIQAAGAARSAPGWGLLGHEW